MLGATNIVMSQQSHGIGPFPIRELNSLMSKLHSAASVRKLLTIAFQVNLDGC